MIEKIIEGFLWGLGFVGALSIFLLLTIKVIKKYSKLLTQPLAPSAQFVTSLIRKKEEQEDVVQ